MLRCSNRIFDYETFVNQCVKTLVIFRTILEKPHVASERRKPPPPPHTRQGPDGMKCTDWLKPETLRGSQPRGPKIGWHRRLLRRSRQSARQPCGPSPWLSARTRPNAAQLSPSGRRV